MGQLLYVHVVDSDSTRRAAIASELYSKPIHVEIYENLDELIARAPSRGLVLAHADPASLDEIKFIEAIRAQAGYLPVAFYSAEPSPEKIVKAMLSGALDYMRWPSPTGLKGTVMRVARAGEERAQLEERRTTARRRVEALTPRERDVLVWIAVGDSNREIGKRLGISFRTVEIHRGNMLLRLNARSTADAVRIGLQSGLIE